MRVPGSGTPLLNRSAQCRRAGRGKGTPSSCWTRALGFHVTEHLGRGATKGRKNSLETHKGHLQIGRRQHRVICSHLGLQWQLRICPEDHRPMSSSQAPQATCCPIQSHFWLQYPYPVAFSLRPLTDHLNFPLVPVHPWTGVRWSPLGSTEPACATANKSIFRTL